MNSLASCVEELIQAVVSDTRWNDEADSFGLAILGMIISGYAVAHSPIFMVDHNDAFEVVGDAYAQHFQLSPSWVDQLIANARASAFDSTVHSGHHELISVGKSYLGIEDLGIVVDNVYQNISAWRSHQFG